MPNNSLYFYVTTSGQYQEFLAKIKGAKLLGLDLEFDRNRYGYGFNICLIQCYIDSTCFIIDPIELNEPLDEFYSELASEKNEIVCFSFSEDYKLLKLSGCSPTNVRDLDIACSLLNYPKKSLVNVLVEHLQMNTSKSSQKSNWLLRPLSKNQLNYAAEDVIYLLDLFRGLKAKLTSMNRYDWFLSENQWHYTLEVDANDSKVGIKNKDLLGLNESEAHLFKGLFEWRDQMAKSRNKPPYQMIDNHYLKLIIKDSHKINEWLEEPAIHHSLKSREILNQVKALIHQLQDESRALGLRTDKDAIQPMSTEEFDRYKNDKNLIKQARNQVFGLLKDQLIKNYGKHVQSFLLSNRVIEEIVIGKKAIPPYRFTLFHELVGDKLERYLPKNQ